MELRPYQKECVETVNALPAGSRTIACLATGLGKTATAAHFKFEGRVLWLSHRDELVRQPERYFKELGYTYGIEKAGEKSSGEDVVSASIQTICRDGRLKRFKPDDFDFIICDEAQHAAAPTYRKVLGYFRPRKLVGLTATPNRGDGARLTDSFDDICFVRDLKWGIENGYLARLRCVRVRADYDMNLVDKSLGDFAASSLGKEMDGSDDDVVIAKAYGELCRPEKRQTLIYCPTVKNCAKTAETLKRTLPKEERGTVEVLTDKTSPEKRKEILDGYRAGKIRCVINCMILTEGTDLPETSCVINNRPTANAALYQQIIGRGTRLAEGKDYCLIIDVVGKNSERKSLCTAPTLFGIDPDMLSEKARKEMEGRDLLEFSAAVSESRAELAKQAKLVKEFVDLFAQERIDAVKRNAPRGFKGIAEEYERSSAPETIPDFGFDDVLVKRTPFDGRFYRIDASFEGRIYLSKPDALGRTVVDADVPEAVVNGKPLSFISPPMRMKEAGELVRIILTCAAPATHRVTWSKSAREDMRRKPATDKQKGKLKIEFGEYGVEDDADGLNRLEASDLIGLMDDLTRLRKEAAETEKAATEASKKRKGKSLEKWLEKQKKAERKRADAEKRRADAWEGFRKALNDAERRRKSAKEAAIRAEEKRSRSPQPFETAIDYSYFRVGTPPTARQIALLESLAESAARKGYEFDEDLTDPTALGLDSWRTSLLIGYAMTVNRTGPTLIRKKAVFQASDFIAGIKEIESVNGPRTMGCSYSLKSKDEGKIR